MACSTACKLATLGGILIALVVTLVLVKKLGPGICPSGELMYRYNESESECFPAGRKGPCPSNLVLLAENSRSSYGQCSCPFTEFNRTLIYDWETEKCHFIFTQAFCDEGEWLTLKKEGDKWTPLCEENPCHGEKDSLGKSLSVSELYDELSHELVPLKGGACGRLGEECEETKGSGAILRFHKGYVLPSCNSPPVRFTADIASIGVPASNCQSGSYLSIVGKCQPQFQFDFD